MATTMKEALFAELLLDAEKLTNEIKQLKEGWASTIEEATKQGINSASLNSKMAFEKVMTDYENKLTQKAKEAAQVIEKAQEKSFNAFLKTHQAINIQGKRFIIICSGVSFLAATIGSFLAIYLSKLI